QRAATINDMLSRAAKEKRWDAVKQTKIKERILEMLLELDHNGGKPMPLEPDVIRGKVAVDFDGDGWFDVIVDNEDVRARLYIGVPGQRGITVLEVGPGPITWQKEKKATPITWQRVQSGSSRAVEAIRIE